jgi:hypothetical protein
MSRQSLGCEHLMLKRKAEPLPDIERFGEGVH